ncbi:MAG: non-homologous end-joining DNA ligase [Ruminococcus sp.]|nr:non-homologous end-joining DNA ligase [Ruminococcus sp.]
MSNNLKEYNQKRDFTKTNEPKGTVFKTSKKLRFVVQHHLARKDHYDFRLELDGVLLSWAVPKGPSYNPKDKRLAVHVEDHPLSYRNFEGVIPVGEYGAGPVQIWDYGYWEPLENPKTSMDKGTLKFILKGIRLKGAWTLVKFKDNNWLLIKDKDEYNEFDDIKKLNTSVKTGRTIDEILNNKPKKKVKESTEEIEITNPDKIIYKKPKITKKEIVEYYKVVAKRMLPYLENRLISTIRCPDGIDKEQFFKKHLKENKYLGKKILKGKESKQDDYYYIKDINGLIKEVQMNSIEFHIWGSTINNLNKPDMLVFDLDPDEAISLKKLREGVRDLKRILDNLKLKAYLKTSGGKGYHIVVPIKNIKSWQEFRKIAENIAKLMETKWPDKYTTNIRKDKRTNKIFIDWFRNTKGATSVAPYSLRARKNAPLSMPISWRELDTVKPNSITLKDALIRIKKRDPWKNFFN